ncbi:MAG: acyloxyacyl hydrolase, partial [Synechococcus sp. LacPavin_0920_WC12_MAG_50_7]|nr:acyloxyacyl hydrolase [Synechococcus sp. LacPavin_0920_WC12_MAG_50_7]
VSIGFENSVPVRVPSNSAYSNESFESKQTVAPNVAIGKSFSGAWRAEVEYVGYFADTALKATFGGVDYIKGGYMIDTNAFFFNIFKDFPTSTKFTPYLGVGIGPAFTRYSTPAVGSESGTSFAGQGKAGISYSASPKTDIYIGYRILGLTGGTKLGFWSDKPTTESSFQQSLDAGIRYRF